MPSSALRRLISSSRAYGSVDASLLAYASEFPISNTREVKGDWSGVLERRGTNSFLLVLTERPRRQCKEACTDSEQRKEVCSIWHLPEDKRLTQSVRDQREGIPSRNHLQPRRHLARRDESGARKEERYVYDVDEDRHTLLCLRLERNPAGEARIGEGEEGEGDEECYGIDPKAGAERNSEKRHHERLQ